MVKAKRKTEKKESRQVKLYRRRQEEGRCTRCGKKRHKKSRSSCRACLLDDRKRKQEKLGHEPRQQNDRGRPAIL